MPPIAQHLLAGDPNRTHPLRTRHVTQRHQRRHPVCLDAIEVDGACVGHRPRLQRTARHPKQSVAIAASDGQDRRGFGEADGVALRVLRRAEQQPPPRLRSAMELDAACLGQRLDRRVAVTADGEAHPAAQLERQEAVAEVELGRGAHDDASARRLQPRLVAGRGVGQVHRSEALVDQPRVGEHLQGPTPEGGLACRHLRRLLCDVGVHHAVKGSELAQPRLRHRAHRVWRQTKADAFVATGASAQAGDGGERVLGPAAGEAALVLLQRQGGAPGVDAGGAVADPQQGDA